MHDYWRLALVFVTGLLLGGVFFGGLWWTVRQGVVSTRPALLFLGSLLLRTSVVLTGFYWLGDDWLLLLVCLLGFVCARLIVSQLTESLILVYQSKKNADSHAP